MQPVENKIDDTFEHLLPGELDLLIWNTFKDGWRIPIVGIITPTEVHCDNVHNAIKPSTRSV